MNSTPPPIDKKKIRPSEANHLLKIIAINVNSIKHNARRLELLNLLSTTNPDIAPLSETKLNENDKITFADYNLIRTDQPNSTNGGGTAVLIKRDFNYDVIKQPSFISNELVEYTIININTDRKYFNNIYFNRAQSTILQAKYRK